MTHESTTARTNGNLRELSSRLSAMVDSDPAEAVRQAREIDLTSSDRLNAMSVRAAILVDGGAASRQQDAIEEGLGLFRKLYEERPDTGVAYNLANGLVSVVGYPPRGPDWLDHQERTREQRAEARQLYWRVARDEAATQELRTQAWTNVANQFAHSYRLGEAHDARLAALAIDPSNGVAAGSAARDLIWLFNQGGCSDLTRVEAVMLAKVAKQHQDRVRDYAGQGAADELAALADQLGDSPPRSPHRDPFVQWVERERLTLSPVVELVDPALGKLDWLMLLGILEREPGAEAATPPPLFAMFNVLKADFMLARDLAWRATSEAEWPTTGRFADTLDYATYGPDASALVLTHRTALDLLDKVAVTANHDFELGQSPNKVYFGRLWRENGGKRAGPRPLAPAVDKAILAGAHALYGLAELAEDYDSESGILRSQKDLRNAGTHRFVVLHDMGDPTGTRQAAEVEHHRREGFADEVRRALREYLTFVAASGGGGVEAVYADENVWLSQKILAQLYDVEVPTINYHLKKVFSDSELEEEAVIRNFRITAADDKTYDTKHYNLSAIIAVGYKVNSERAVQFRKWATRVIEEFTIKGFAMDDERLKRGGSVLSDRYFEEQLQRIREIRLSERKF